MRFWLAVLVLLWALPSAAQAHVGGLNFSAAGDLMLGYSGDYDNQGGSDHTVGLSGAGTVSGYYYVPQFLSFNVMPFYNRSQNNSTSQSIFDSSGYTANVNLFSGSRSPVGISFSQGWDSSGLFGIPGVAGLISKDSYRGFSIGSGISFLNLPSLSFGFSDGDSSSSVVGSDTTSSATTRTYNLGSSYRIRGFSLVGGFIHTNTDSNLLGALADGETENSSSSSNSFSISVTHKLPFFRSTIAGGFGRSTYNDDSDGLRSHGATDNANVSTYLPFPKLPVTLNATYTDNLYGSLQQQQVSAGQPLLPASISPESHLLIMNASTYYKVRPNLGVNGFVDRTEEYIAGQDYGVTQLGINANYNFLRKIKGLTITVGVVDSASQLGNNGTSAVANATYSHKIGKWEMGANFGYNQSLQTLGVVYTSSSLNYGANVRRKFGHAYWMAGGAGDHSGFGLQSGSGSSAGFVYSSLSLWRRVILSANVSESRGTSVLTSNGQVALPLPPQLISANNIIAYNANGHEGTVHWTVMRYMGLDLSYSKSDSTNVNSGLNTFSSTSQYYGFLTYRLRKLLFTAGATRVQQSISGPGNVPSTATSYSFGVSRWFKAF
jgi:hypothetical protein